MSGFDIRGLEIHNPRMWNWKDVNHSLHFMSEFGLNALIFHQVDLIDQVVLPRAYFSEQYMWEHWPVRYCEVETNKAYLNEVIRRANRQGIGFYLEVKEIWYPESLTEVIPGLKTADGQVCCSNPFWFEFLNRKIVELLEALPDLSGLIVSPATRESKVSISKNSCQCERCKRTDPKSWYRQLIQAMYNPLSEKGKTFVVRDFSYTVEHQNLIVEAAKECSEDIVIALKNVPHDFWPTFPHNPKIGDTFGLEQWVEFDVWGQYSGNGVFPCSLVEDLQYRMNHCKEQGVRGVWFRTDIEFISENHVFNSFNALNMIGAAKLAVNPKKDLDGIYKDWVHYGLHTSLTPGSEMGNPVRPAASDAADRLKRFMKASWSVLEKTLFVKGHVFQYSSQFQQSIDSIYNVMVNWHGREKWDPGSSKYIELTDENLASIFEEKESAIAEVQQLDNILEPDTLGLPDTIVAEIKIMLDLYRLYVKGFEASAKAYFLTRKALETKTEADIETAKHQSERLKSFSHRLASKLKGTEYPHYVYWMMSPNRLLELHQDIESKLQALYNH